MLLTPHILHHYLYMIGASPFIGEMCSSMCCVECQSQFTSSPLKAHLSFEIQLLGALSLHDRIGKSRLALSRENGVDVSPFSGCDLPDTASPFCNVWSGIISLDNQPSLTFFMVKTAYFWEDRVNMALDFPLLVFGQNAN
jgi:hypothetical protein